MTEAALRPVRQRRRIATLRAALLLLLPLMVFTRPAWDGVSHPLAAILHEIFENLGVLTIIAAVLGRFWSILYAGGRKNAAVLREGPYSVCRHPLYLFSTIGAAGFGMMLGSVTLAVLLTGVIGAILVVTARLEEDYLRSAFGPAYAAYAAEVPMILPRPRLWRSGAQVVVDVGALRRNLFDALVFLSLIPLAELLEYLKEVAGIPTVPLW